MRKLLALVNLIGALALALLPCGAYAQRGWIVDNFGNHYPLVIAGQGMGPGPGVGITYGGGGSPPTIRNSATSAASNSPVTVDLPTPVVGNLIVVFVPSFGSCATNALTDDASNTYTRRATAQDANGNWMNLFTAPVTSAGSGNLTITAAVSCSTAIVAAAEVQAQFGIDASATTGTYSGNGPSTVDAGGITTTVANDLILSCAINQNSSVMTANTGTAYSSGTQVDYHLCQQRTVSATGTYTEKINVPASVGETAVIAAIAIKGT